MKCHQQGEVCHLSYHPVLVVMLKNVLYHNVLLSKNKYFVFYSCIYLRLGGLGKGAKGIYWGEAIFICQREFQDHLVLRYFIKLWCSYLISSVYFIQCISTTFGKNKTKRCMYSVVSTSAWASKYHMIITNIGTTNSLKGPWIYP